MLRRLLIVSICTVFGLLTLSGEAFGCTCGPRPTVLDAFGSASFVVTARLASVDKIREREREYDVGYIRSVTMIVDKIYKGDVNPGTELKFGQGGGADCVWTYDEQDIGAEFLFYLRSPSVEARFGEGMNSATVFPREGGPNSAPMFYPITCGRSRGLKYAWDDLAYLDNLAKVKGRTRISGTFDTWSRGDFNPTNISVKLVGKSKTFTAKTDKNGFFEIYDLPAGDYVAQINIPFGWKINDYMARQTSTGYEEWDPAGQQTASNKIPLRIAPGGHATLDLIFDIDTAIKGKVLSPTGRPMKGVCVMAVSTELAEGDHRGQSDCTDEKGEFVIDEMGPGNYRLLANYDGQADADEPFGVVFWPGVADRANAGVVAVEPRQIYNRACNTNSGADRACRVQRAVPLFRWQTSS